MYTFVWHKYIKRIWICCNPANAEYNWTSQNKKKYL